jgi:hypothetical protein
MVLMEMSIDSAGPMSLRVPVDPEPLDRIRDVECSELAVRRAVGVAFSDVWATEGSGVRTELVFTHLDGGEAVVVESVGGMILFGMQPDPDREPPLAILEPGADPIFVPVDLTLIRCDVHAVSQAPDGYAFRVWMAVGDRDPFAIRPGSPVSPNPTGGAGRPMYRCLASHRGPEGCATDGGRLQRALGLLF